MLENAPAWLIEMVQRTGDRMPPKGTKGGTKRANGKAKQRVCKFWRKTKQITAGGFEAARKAHF